MGAILAGIGVKDYVYAALILALIGSFALYTHHERVIGANEALAPVAVLAQKAQVAVSVGTAIAAGTEKDNGNAYKAAVAAPRPADLGIVCHGSGSGAVPKTDTGSPAGTGQPAADRGVGPAFDPSGAVLQRAAAADAQITYLQGRVKELEAQMESSP